MKLKLIIECFYRELSQNLHEANIDLKSFYAKLYQNLYGINIDS